MSGNAIDKDDRDPNIGKECPVCEQEYHGVCPLLSSDCPFVYDGDGEDEDDEDLEEGDDLDDLDLEEEDAELLPDFGLDDDFEEDDEEPDFLDDAAEDE